MNKLLQKLTGALLVFLLLLPLACTTVLAASTTQDYGFKGLTMSVLGDSISTYKGVSDNIEYNSTLSDGGNYHYSYGRFGVDQANTWWQQAIDRLGMELLVNNSWSGSALLTEYRGAAPAYQERCLNLHNDHLANPEDPDIIAIFLGTNDLNINLAYGYAMGSATPDYGSLITEQPDGTFTYAEPASFADAYVIMLHKISVRYPNAEVYCLSLLQRNATDATTAQKNSLVPYNTVIRTIAEHFNAYYVDQYNECGITSDSTNATYYMADTLHPNEAGMDAMTSCFVSALLKNSKYSTVKDSLYTVSYNLGNVLPEEGTMKTAVSGAPFTMPLTTHNDYNFQINVTMGGQDVSAQCYENNTVSIPAVTGDIVITATKNPSPLFCDGIHEGWTALTGNAIEADGKYYLSADQTTGITVSPGITATLCLCGHSIVTGETALSVSSTEATEATTVNLVNCSAEGGTLTHNASGSYAIEVYTNSTLNIGSDIHVDNSKADGALHLAGQSLVNMYAGTVSNNQSAKYGAVTVESGSTFNLYGGTISNNTAATNGAGVYIVDGGAFNMYGGSISGNTATDNGGGVYTAGTAQLIGGIITGNKAVNGGGVFVADSNFTMTNGTIGSNTATGKGGGVYMAGGTFDLTGGYISGNTGGNSNGSGGGVRLDGGSLTMSGGTISGNSDTNSSNDNGNGVSLSGTSTFTMNGGLVDGNGNVLYGVGYSKAFLNSGTVNGDIAPGGGNATLTISDTAHVTGSVSVYGKLLVTGGCIEGTVSSNVSGNVFGNVTITGGQFKGKISLPNSSASISISGGRFSNATDRSALASFLATDKGMLSVLNNTDADSDTYQYKVGKGLVRVGEFMDFQSSLDMAITLMADVNFNYNAAATTLTVAGEAVSPNVDTVNQAVTFTIPCIAAKNMDQTYAVVLKDGDTVLYSETLSVYDLTKEWYADDNHAAQKVLLEDMINYGIEAQKEFLETHTSTMDNLGDGTTDTPDWSTANSASVPSDYASKIAATLSLKDRIELNIYINDADATVSDVAGTDTYALERTNGVTRISFREIPVSQAKNAVSFTVHLDENDSFAMTYSIADYVVNALADESNPQKDLLVALQKYVDSVVSLIGPDNWITPDFGASETNPVPLPTF